MVAEMKKGRDTLGILMAVMITMAVMALAVLFVKTMLSETDETGKRKVYAMIQMPDGSVVSGECSRYDRNDRYVAVYMGNQVYKASDWRVVIWYEQPKQGR
jgi:hypothetical protein